MRLCSIEDVHEGMILGKSIHDFDGRLLLKEGCSISSTMKSRIKNRGHNYIYIHEEGTEEVNPEEIISDQIRLQANVKLLDKTNEISKIAQFQDMSHDKAVKLIQDGHLKEANINSDMKKIVEEIVNDISATGAKFLNSIMLKSTDTYFMDHAINTTVIAILIAQRYRFNTKEIKYLALGTFLHDIGKTIIEKLNDYDDPKRRKIYYKEHPTFGYNMLKDSSNVSPMETQIVFQHHEYQDGSGFPNALSGENQPPIRMPDRASGRIFRFAEICCVANAYDKMLLNPVSGKKMAPHDVLKQLIVDSGTKYNKHIVSTLFQVVPTFPVGAYISVIDASNPLLINTSGVVVKINENNPHKPVIVLTKNKYKKKMKPIIVNTSELEQIKLKMIL